MGADATPSAKEGESRLLGGSGRLRELKLAELRRLVEEGWLRGAGNPAEDVFARLQAKYRAMAEQDRA